MGWGDPSCFASDSRIATPHIDQLAREGMRFTDAHAPGAWCVPSRYGLLTGRYPCRRGPLRPSAEPVIEEGRVTLAAFLSERGYRTAMVGKWHLGFDGAAQRAVQEARGEAREHLLAGGPLDRGFDTYFGIPSSLDIPPYYYVRGRAPVALPSERVEASASAGWTKIQGAFWRAGRVAPGFAHDAVLPRFEEEVCAVLADHAARGDEAPLFLYLALPSPHTPWLPAPELQGSSGAGSYGDFVLHTDRVVGAVLAALEEHGLAEETLVVFTSDNGPVWYPADEERFGHRSTGPWRGMKSDSWEGGHRMPFIVRWPGRVAPGTSSERFVCFTDLFATCAEALAVSVPPGVAEDSVSFLPTLAGEPQAPRGPTVLRAGGQVVRDGRWKWIGHWGSGGFSEPRGGTAGPGEPAGQLYDLDADPGETRNVWAAHPDVVARLSQVSEAVLGAATER